MASLYALWCSCLAVGHFIAAVLLARAFGLQHQPRWLSRAAAATASSSSRALRACGAWLRRLMGRPARLSPAASSQGSQGAGCRLRADGSDGGAQPLGLSWWGVGCTYATGSGVKGGAQVLQGGLGHVRPGGLAVLIGPSGSGKSTLLEVLAGRKAVGALAGEVAVVAPGRAGGPPSAAWRGVEGHRREALRLSAFVPQDDAFPASLTAGEVLAFHAALLLPPYAAGAKGERGRRVRAALASMGLTAQQHTLVGGPLPGGLQLRGLSGGERKRLAVAVGCLPQPQLLLLDEPTTGLDSASALGVMGHLRAMARAPAGQTVIASLHQPRAAMWEMVDTAVVLSAGRTLYAGPPSLLVPWFSCLGYPYLPRHGSAPDWAMDLVNVGFQKPKRFYTGKTMDSIGHLHEAAAAFAAQYAANLGAVRVADPTAKPEQPSGAPPSDAHCAAPGSSEAADSASAALCLPPSVLHSPGGPLHKPARAPSHHQPMPCISLHIEGPGATAPNSSIATAASGKEGGRGDVAAVRRTSWLGQVWALCWRELQLLTRNPADVAGRILVFSWCGFAVGAVFYSLADNVQGLQSRASLLYAEVAVFFLLPYCYISLFTADKRLVISDVAARLYHPSAFYAAKTLVMLPFAALNAVLFTGIAYGMAGLRSDNGGVPIVQHMVIGVLGYMLAQQVLYFAAVLAPNQDLAFVAAIAWTAANVLLANFPLRTTEYTMSWVTPLRHISAIHYAHAGLMAAEFTGGRVYSCADGLGTRIAEALPDYLPRVTALELPFVQRILRSPGSDCRIDPQSVLTFFAMTWQWRMYVAALVVYLVVLHAATYGALLLAVRHERR